MDSNEITARSRRMTYWLRHKPQDGGLTLSKEGWVAIPAILSALEEKGLSTTRAEFNLIVAVDPKGRFEVEGDRVRARYGHSIALEEKPHPGKPPSRLYHGTARRFLPKILETGLKPMKRQYVHLSPDTKTARVVGLRRDASPAILIVLAHEAHAAGVQFYPRGKGIWLSDPIPPEFLQVADGHGGADPLQEPPVSGRSVHRRARRPGKRFIKRRYRETDA
jgi:putative RNA 2'-phosphotransferase